MLVNTSVRKKVPEVYVAVLHAMVHSEMASTLVCLIESLWP